MLVLPRGVGRHRGLAVRILDPEPQGFTVGAGLADNRPPRNERSDASKGEAARRPPSSLDSEAHQESSLERTMDDETRIALHLRYVGIIVVDAVAIESQGRVAEQQHGIAGPDPLAGRLRQRDFGRNCSRGTTRVSSAVDDVLTLLECRAALGRPAVA